MNRKDFVKLGISGILTLGGIGLISPLFKCGNNRSLESNLNLQVEKTKFEQLYNIITGEEKPDDVQLTVFPLKQYIEIYKNAYGKEPDLSEWGKGYTGNIEFTYGNEKRSHIIVLENVEDFLFESISHGIGHVKYAMEFFKRNPEGNLMEDTDKIVRETAANTAVQRALDRNNPKKYIRTPYYYQIAWFGDSQDRVGTEYTAKLIQKYGIDRAWKKILDTEREGELEKLL